MFRDVPRCTIWAETHGGAVGVQMRTRTPTPPVWGTGCDVVKCPEMSVSMRKVLEQIHDAGTERRTATGRPRVAGVLARRGFALGRLGVQARRLHAEETRLARRFI